MKPSPNLSKFQNDFLERVAARMREDGYTQDKCTPETCLKFILETVQRELAISRILLEKGPETQGFRDAFYEQILLLCQEKNQST